MIRRAPRRPGYTLLEVLLASVIAVILLAALYVALDVSLKQMDASRDAVSGNDLSRAVVNRMGSDLTGVLGVLPPNSGGTNWSSPSGSGGTPTGGATTGTGATPATGAATGIGQAGATAQPAATAQAGATSTAAPTAGAATAADPGTDPTQANLPFHAGLFGTDKQLTVFVSRVPTALTDPSSAADPNAVLPSDLRRVTYYLGSNGGLCRQERPWVTADGVGNSTDPDLSTEDADLIAPEVKDVTFEYWDGTTWQTEWDGTMTATDGTTIVGTPRAIRVTFVLQSPGRGGTATEKRVQHVFPVRAGVGTYTPPDAADTTGTAGATTGGM